MDGAQRSLKESPGLSRMPADPRGPMAALLPWRMDRFPSLTPPAALGPNLRAVASVLWSPGVPAGLCIPRLDTCLPISAQASLTCGRTPGLSVPGCPVFHTCSPGPLTQDLWGSHGEGPGRKGLPVQGQALPPSGAVGEPGRAQSSLQAASRLQLPRAGPVLSSCQEVGFFSSVTGVSYPHKPGPPQFCPIERPGCCFLQGRSFKVE